MTRKFVDEMTPDELTRFVFGENVQFDKQGNPIEMGLGSAYHLKSGKMRASAAAHQREVEKTQLREAQAELAREQMLKAAMKVPRKQADF